LKYLNLEFFYVFCVHLVYVHTWWSFALLFRNLVYFAVIYYISTRFGILYQEKSGNPEKADNEGPCLHKQEKESSSFFVETFD
jgi:hypothetical protein